MHAVGTECSNQADHMNTSHPFSVKCIGCLSDAEFSSSSPHSLTFKTLQDLAPPYLSDERQLTSDSIHMPWTKIHLGDRSFASLLLVL